MNPRTNFDIDFIRNSWISAEGGPAPTDDEIEKARSCLHDKDAHQVLALAVGFRACGSTSPQRTYAHNRLRWPGDEKATSRSANNYGALGKELRVQYGSSAKKFFDGRELPLQVESGHWVFARKEVDVRGDDVFFVRLAPEHVISELNKHGASKDSDSIKARRAIADDTGRPNAETVPSEQSRRFNTLRDDIDEIKANTTLSERTKTVLIEARLGQGKFRSDLDKRWGEACAVTGCKERAVLRASHIKPWRDSTDHEKLDPDNGLLLSAHLDALFDKGLISFGDDGNLKISGKVQQSNLDLLEISRLAKLRIPLNAKQKDFLKSHREKYGF